MPTISFFVSHDREGLLSGTKPKNHSRSQQATKQKGEMIAPCGCFSGAAHAISKEKFKL